MPSWASPSAPSQTVQSKTADYTALATDDVILVNTNAVTITLYAASAATKPLKVCKIGSDTNLVTITRAGSDNIVTNGGNRTSTVLHRGGECITLVGDGTSKFYLDEDTRTEEVFVAGTCSSTPCTITHQTGAWVSSFSRSSTGLYAVNFVSGIFSTAPSCVAYSNQLTVAGGTPTTSIANVTTINTSGVVADAANIQVICKGAR